MSESAEQWSVVVLDARRVPVFPHVCVRCGAVATRRAHQRVHRLRPPSPYLLVPRSFEVPVCTKCHRRRLLRHVVMVVWLLVPVAFGLQHVGSVPASHIDLPRSVRLLVACGLVLVLVLVLWQVPRVRFDITFDGHGVRFSFKDSDLARAFAARNGVTSEPALPAAASPETVGEREPSGWTSDAGEAPDTSGDD